MIMFMMIMKILAMVLLVMPRYVCFLAINQHMKTSSIDIYFMIMDVKHEKVLNCVFPIGCETGPFWSTENIGPIIPLDQKHSILTSFHS